PAASRAFVRDKLRLPSVDVGGGWLIFDLPQADIGFHPADSSGGATPGTHDVSLFCDDIEGTVAELEKRGVEVKQPPADRRYGHVPYCEIPGGIEVQLYEPKYSKSGAAPRKPAKKKPAKKKKAAAKRAPAGRAKKKAARRRSSAR